MGMNSVLARLPRTRHLASSCFRGKKTVSFVGPGGKKMEGTERGDPVRESSANLNVLDSEGGGVKKEGVPIKASPSGFVMRHALAVVGLIAVGGVYFSLRISKQKEINRDGASEDK